MTDSISNTQLKDGSLDGEITLLDIMCFIKSAWKAIILGGVLGLSTAITYLLITPQQYEATAQIVMAQIGVSRNNSNNNSNHLNPLGVNIEEPSLLISRLSSPASFTPQIIKACGFQDQTYAALGLKKTFIMTIPKGVTNVVELKTFGPTPQAAQACAQSIFDLIKTSQADIVAPFIEEANAKLEDDEERLQKAKDLLSKADKSGAAMGAVYLSTRDEIRYLLDEIAAQKYIANQNRATRLIVPIYAADMPIFPNKRVALATGLLAGLFSGLLFALGQKMIVKMKDEMHGVL